LVHAALRLASEPFQRMFFGCGTRQQARAVVLAMLGREAA